MSNIGHNGAPPAIFGGDGWIAIHRSIRDHWLVGFGHPVKPADASRGSCSTNEAFQDLVMECKWDVATVVNGGRKMTIQPGQVIGAVSWLANRWNWTPKTVRTFLDKLEADETIRRHAPGAENNKQSGTQAAIITICNYENYQFAQTLKGKQGASKGQANPASKGQANNAIEQTTYPELSEQVGQARGKQGEAEKGDIYKEEHLTLNTREDKKAETRISSATQVKSGNNFWAKAMHVEGSFDPNEGVSWDNGSIQLMNGVRAHWLAEFGGDEKALDLALITAANYVQPESRKPLKTQVQAQLARAIAENLARDKRYNRRANSDPAATDVKETKPERIARICREAELGVRK